VYSVAIGAVVAGGTCFYVVAAKENKE